ISRDGRISSRTAKLSERFLTQFEPNTSSPGTREPVPRNVDLIFCDLPNILRLPTESPNRICDRKSPFQIDLQKERPAAACARDLWSHDRMSTSSPQKLSMGRFLSRTSRRERSFVPEQSDSLEPRLALSATPPVQVLRSSTVDSKSVTVEY